MRIVIDARFYGLENGGIGRYTMNFVRELGQSDKDNEYFLLTRKKYYKDKIGGANFTNVLAEIPHYSFAEQIRLPKLIKNLKPDLTHFLHFNIPYTFNGPFVVTIHDILMHKEKGKRATTRSYPMYRLKRFGYRMVFDHAIKKSKVIFVPTKTIKKEILEIYKINEDKIVVTYEGVDPTIKNAKKTNKFVTPKNPYFLCVGNAYPHKNLERAISAIVYLNEVLGKKTLLVIATPKNLFSEKLARKVKAEKAQSYVDIRVGRDDDELSYLYKNAIAFIYPSLSEGFGLPALEAMSVGTLAMTSDIEVFHEVYGNSAIYINPHDFTQMAHSMERVINLPKEIKEDYREKGFSTVKKYSWSEMTSIIKGKYTLR